MPIAVFGTLGAGPTSRARDALSDTFTVAWRRLDEVPVEPLPWLFGVCQ